MGAVSKDTCCCPAAAATPASAATAVAAARAVATAAVAAVAVAAAAVDSGGSWSAYKRLLRYLPPLALLPLLPRDSLSDGVGR